MTTPAFTRRQFLKSSIIAGASATLAPLVPLTPRLYGAQPGQEPRVTTPSWVDKPMRWAQLTLVEDDPGKFDPSFWFDYFRRTRSDAVCLSGGGCVAYYPTQIPFHHRSKWLGDRDAFGELVAGCPKPGMVGIVTP